MMTYYVRSTDGSDYRVGVWNGGEFQPGDRHMAIMECHLLKEPGAYVWGRTWTSSTGRGW